MLGRWMLRGAVALVVAGCGGKDHNQAPARTEPEQKCDALVEHWCSHALDCAVQGNLITQSDEPLQHDVCVSEADGDCDGALIVTSGYDDCMSMIDSDDCATIDAGITSGNVMLPAACMSVIEK